MRKPILNLLVLTLLASGCGTAPESMSDPCWNPKEGQKLYAYGDSIVFGRPEAPSYVQEIACRLSLKLMNYAVNGSKIVDKNQAELILSTEWEKDAVILFAPGVNDAIQGIDPNYLETYRKLFQAVVDKIVTRGNTAYLGTPIRTCDPENYMTDEELAPYVTMNTEIIQAATESHPNIHFIDFHSGFLPTVGNTFDCLHPTQVGTGQMAQYFFSQLSLGL